MADFIFAPEAKADLKGLWEYIRENDPQAANKIVAILKEKCQMLVNNPMMGRSRNELAVNLRSFPVNRYIIFYRPNDNGIEVVRILHGAMDIEQLF